MVLALQCWELGQFLSQGRPLLWTSTLALFGPDWSLEGLEIELEPYPGRLSWSVTAAVVGVALPAVHDSPWSSSPQSQTRY